jgi:predicted ABC-type exoprotein transport system permease subunit
MKRMEESKGIYEEIRMFLSTIQLMSFNTDYDKSFMQKIHELTERWRKQIVGTFLFDGAFESSRKQNKT